MIELKDLCFSVDEEGVQKEIIHDVNLVIEDNKFVVITGPNGGGKSTLARLIAGIEKPSSGQIFYNGQDITDMSVTDRAKLGISYAFQQPVRFKGIQVRDLLRIAAGKWLSESEMIDLLAEVGLCGKDYIGREVNASLSGGELKRIEIATILARGSEFALFDEPEAGIDLWSFQNLIKAFEKMREGNTGSIMIISHQERIMDIADEIVIIGNGRITGHGPKDKVLPMLMQTTSIDSCTSFCQGGQSCK